ncbi:MAG: hypothetical protein CMQ34_14545 [Gammaproteobacteria bacterium]|nr:hypothetical protein [Gammaproteobacteria bacterium]|tara:strand:- start:3924 stop:4223 length:300 start_codon:yes stop_codon:yes gene_type:complete
MSSLQHSIPDSAAFVEAKALLAIGMDGTFVVLQVNPENQFLMHDAKLGSIELAKILKFKHPQEPQEPGIYEFTGFSALEPFDAHSVRIIHRGHCVKIAC